VVLHHILQTSSPHISIVSVLELLRR